MARIIDLACAIADVHHRSHQIHGALFGAASFQLIIDALLGRRRHAYKEFSNTLQELHDELGALAMRLTDVDQGGSARGTERELRPMLQDYTQALSAAIAELRDIYLNLEQDEREYRDTGPDGRSRFTRDKLHYDHLLSELERLGTRLNKLFSNY
jgi:chromosome segregation ATPase